MCDMGGGGACDLRQSEYIIQTYQEHGRVWIIVNFVVASNFNHVVLH